MYESKYGIFGPMFSGKTSKLFDVIKHTNVKKYAVIKPVIDTRDAKSIIKTHNGKIIKCHVVQEDNIIKFITEYDTVLIDEVQFFDLEIIKKIIILADKKIYFAGLDLSYTRNYFDTTKYLINTLYPQNIIMLKSICKCGKPAPYTKCKLAISHNTDQPVLIGSEDKYEPACTQCFNK